MRSLPSGGGGGRSHESPSQVPPSATHSASAQGPASCCPGTLGHASTGGGGGGGGGGGVVHFLLGRLILIEIPAALIVRSQNLNGSLLSCSSEGGLEGLPKGNPSQNAPAEAGATANKLIINNTEATPTKRM